LAGAITIPEQEAQETSFSDRRFVDANDAFLESLGYG
jgi:hypothetical protein